jgi:hypothetical protein
MLWDSPSKHETLIGLRKKFAGKKPEIGLGTLMAIERDEGVFESAVVKHAPTVVLPIEPQRLSERLSVQRGTFLCAGNVERPFMENLTAMNAWERNVRKFTLSFEHRGLALEKLRSMNITRASLFPGLDGFAQSFRNYFACETPEQRQQRLAREPLEAFVWEDVKVQDSAERDQQH